MGAAFGLGFVFGPVVGGLPASETAVSAARSALPAIVPVDQFSPPSFAAAAFSLLALVAAALSLLALVAAAVVLEEPERTRRLAGRTTFVAQFRAGLADADLRPLVVLLAVGVTHGAGSLGRTVGPPLAAVAYVVVYWSPLVAGALVLVPVAALLRARA